MSTREHKWHRLMRWRAGRWCGWQADQRHANRRGRAKAAEIHEAQSRINELLEASDAELFIALSLSSDDLAPDEQRMIFGYVAERREARKSLGTVTAVDVERGIVTIA